MPPANPLDIVRDLTDVPHLIEALGYRPAWEAIPPGDWMRAAAERNGVSRAARVSAHDEFPWYALEASDPERAARSAAKQLAGRGEMGVVAALDDDRLAIALAFDKCHVVQFDRVAPTALQRHQLGELARSREPTGLATAARISQILSSENVGQHFFRAFEAGYHAAVNRTPHRVPPGDKRYLVLLHLTRVLFLYFVQAKGWLDERVDFMRTEVDRCLEKRRSIHKHLLQPLFFGTLNRPLESRSASACRFGRIPFLNGGLFEPHRMERRHRLVIGNDTWRDLFDGVFERYRFTVSEAHAGNTIAPDMLGRVFEGLMQSQDRKSTGSYYTPAGLVDDVLHECFTAFVVRRRGMDHVTAGRLVRRRSASLKPLWTDITILDPAAGSGAFLVGALATLAELRFGAQASTAQSRRRILKRHLFGVDKDPMAVRLTELRLWLAIVAAERDTDPGTVRPLPNLDCLVRQGDSLRDPLGVHGTQFVPHIDSTSHARLRRQLFASQATIKSDYARRLRTAEVSATGDCLAAAEDRLSSMLEECRTEARDRSLFGDRRGPDRHIRRRVNQVRESLRTVRRYRTTLERDGALPWFHYQGHFGDVFARSGGFDLVVGNPPWVRAEAIDAVERRQLKERYRWWRSGLGKGYGHQPDLSLAFLERGLELTAPDGILGFLLPAKLLTTAYGATVRTSLARETTLHVVADLTESRAASFEATAYPLVVVVGKGVSPPGHGVRRALDDSETTSIPQRLLLEQAHWGLPGGSHDVVARLTTRQPRLDETLTCHLGVKTGANAVFLSRLPDGVADRWQRPAVRGRNLRAWRVTGTTPLLWPCSKDGTVLEELPESLVRYFRRHGAVLRARADHRSAPLWQLFRTRPAATRHRVTWSDLSRRLEAVPLVEPATRDVVPLNTCYLVSLPLRRQALAVAAWLNSAPIRGLARLTADVARGGYARFNAGVVGSLPMPRTVLGDAVLTDLARQALGGADIQPELDSHVARMLDMTPADLAALCPSD